MFSSKSDNRALSALITELGFFDRVRTGELMNRLSEDTRLMKSAGTVSISVALRSIVVAVFGLILMFQTSPLLTGLSLVSSPFLTSICSSDCSCNDWHPCP